MKHVIFDFDGTIADTFPVALEIGEAVIRRKVTEDINDLKNMTVRELMKLYKIPMHEIPRMVIQSKMLLTKKMDEISLIRGMPEIMEELVKSGHILHIVSSNKPTNITNFLKKNQIDRYFTSVQGNVGVFGKARALNKVLKKQDIQKDDCVYIGDEVRDIEGAKKVGIKVISVTWGFNGEKILKASHPQALVSKSTDLVEAIAKIGAY